MRYGDLSHGFMFGEVFKGRQKYFVDKKESVHVILKFKRIIKLYH